MDYDENVKNVKNSYLIDDVLSRPQLTKFEYEIGNGAYYRGILYILTALNLSLLMHRTKIITAKNRSIAYLSVLFFSFPIANFLSKHLFGYSKLRSIQKIDEHNLLSANYYQKALKH
jgi:hypothetical protein